MAAPLRRAESHTTANGTANLIVGNASLSQGDLILLWASNEEATPNFTVATTGTITLSSGTGTNLFTGGAGGNWQGRSADTTNNLYNHVWALRVTAKTGTCSITFTPDTSAGSWSAGTRRFGWIAVDPNGNQWDTDTYNRRGNSNVANGTNPFTVSWSGSHSSAAGVGIALAHLASSKTYKIDFDNDGDYTLGGGTSGQAADTGDGGSTTILGGTDVGTNSAVLAADGYWDTGGIPGGSDSQVGFNGSNATSTKSALVVLFSVHATNTVSGTLSLAGGGTVSIAGTPTVLGTLALAGGGTLTVHGTPSVLGTLLLAGGGSLHADQQGVATITGTMSLVGTGTLSANGFRLRTGTMSLIGGGTFSGAGIRSVIGTVHFTGGGTLGATQLLAVNTYDTGTTWSNLSQVRVGGLTKNGTLALSGGGTFAAHGLIAAHNSGILFFTNTATLHATGVRTTVGTMSLNGGGIFRMLAVPPSEPPTCLILDRSANVVLDRNTHVILEH